MIETTLRTAEINGVVCVLLYPKPVHLAIAHALKGKGGARPASPILWEPASRYLLQALRLAKRRAA